jgi:hypothetical protein
MDEGRNERGANQVKVKSSVQMHTSQPEEKARPPIVARRYRVMHGKNYRNVTNRNKQVRVDGVKQRRCWSGEGGEHVQRVGLGNGEGA